MKRIIKIGVGAVLVLIAAAVAAVFFYIDSAAKAGVEMAASSALGVNTSLNKADVGIFSGSFSMSGLNIDNPPEFAETPFLTLSEGKIAVSLGTLLKETIEVPLLSLDNLHIEIAQRKGKTNYGSILANMQTDRQAPAPSTSTQPAKTFVIKEVSITNVTARLSFAPIGGSPTVVSIPIDKIELTNVGTNKPLPLSELAGVIVQAVFSSVVEDGGALIPPDMLGDLTRTLAGLGDLSELGVTVVSDLSDQAEEMLNNLDQLGKDAQSALEDAANDAIEKNKQKLKKEIGNLLPGSGG
jgi:uncharacterized protein involved in outer membrane biogenesis